MPKVRKLWDYNPPVAEFSIPSVSRWGEDECYVYMAYNEDRRLLYVGISTDVFRRMGSHATSAEWYPQMCYLMLEVYPTRRDAEDREAELIHDYRPRYNTARPTGSRKGRENVPEAPFQARRLARMHAALAQESKAS